MEDEDGSRSVMGSMVGAGWKETSRDRRGKAYEKDGKASV